MQMNQLQQSYQIRLSSLVYPQRWLVEAGSGSLRNNRMYRLWPMLQQVAFGFDTYPWKGYFCTILILLREGQGQLALC